MEPTSLVWLITGCSSGLGYALAKFVAKKGHRVIASSRNPAKSPDYVSEIESLGGKWMTLDVTASNVTEAITEAESFFGHIDVLVNNAGYSLFAAVEDTEDSAGYAQMEANFWGPFRLMKAVLPGMRRRQSGTILNISSTQGLCPSPACGMYAASKHALEGISESLSFEVAPFGIRVLLVEPGAFQTSLVSNGMIGSLIEPSEAYAMKGGPVAERLVKLKTYAGASPGDPEKAARVMFDAVTGEGDFGQTMKNEGLVRFIVGSDSWGRIDDQIKTLRKTADLQKEIAASTDLDK